MPKNRVNLDALIRREDLEITPEDDSVTGRQGGDLSFADLLESANVFQILRKPDFQRDTCDWGSDAIAELVQNQLDDEMIPAVILWKSSSNEIFVIDGAHRLSALIAWVNDDYGAGSISRRFFADNISVAQKKAADLTQSLVNGNVGSYKLLEGFIRNKDGATHPIQIRRANSIGSARIRTQWVQGDAKKAEDSFVRINRGGAVIDDTEKEIIKARDKPEGIATRALLRGGTGYKYWKKFSKKGTAQVVKLAHDVHQILFNPQLEDNHRAYELLPMAGNCYTREALSTLYDLIFVANGKSREDSSQAQSSGLRVVEKTTIEYLATILELSQIILSTEPKSLGLHPAVYCYGATGKFQPAAFFAQIQLVQQISSTKTSLQKFSANRAAFENFLVEHKYFLNQLIHKLGSRTRGLPRISKLYSMALQGVESGLSSQQIKDKILMDGNFAQLSEYASRHISGASGDFESLAKAAVRLREVLSKAALCPECKARMHPFGTTIDHIIRKEDGGASDSSDGQSMHPFCNSGVKERREAIVKKQKLQSKL